jgi:hypothetical protein
LLSKADQAQADFDGFISLGHRFGVNYTQSPEQPTAIHGADLIQSNGRSHVEAVPGIWFNDHLDWVRDWR